LRPYRIASPTIGYSPIRSRNVAAWRSEMAISGEPSSVHTF
jgi:hypothetical protein